jgi:hypothetical protein
MLTSTAAANIERGQESFAGDFRDPEVLFFRAADTS